MSSDAVKKVQEKLFRGGTNPNDDIDNGLPRSEPGLTINIPVAPNTPTQPTAAAPPKSTKPTDPSPNSDQVDPRPQQDDRSYRERLASRLGAEYQGVERYRLEQDQKRERHWKRWGPYVSDRQWVCFFVFSLFEDF